LSVSVKWLAVKTASEMTYIVSGGALNSAHSLTVVDECFAIVYILSGFSRLYALVYLKIKPFLSNKMAV